MRTTGTTGPPTAVAPQGWQPDPTHRHELRYWDGQIPTTYAADQGVQSTDPVAVS